MDSLTSSDYVTGVNPFEAVAFDRTSDHLVVFARSTGGLAKTRQISSPGEVSGDEALI